MRLCGGSHYSPSARHRHCCARRVEKLGAGILRRSWFNVDLFWMIGLVMTGVLTLLV